MKCWVSDKKRLQCSFCPEKMDGFISLLLPGTGSVATPATLRQESPVARPLTNPQVTLNNTSLVCAASRNIFYGIVYVDMITSLLYLVSFVFIDSLFMQLCAISELVSKETKLK
jgi:hypothetical protein